MSSRRIVNLPRRSPPPLDEQILYAHANGHVTDEEETAETRTFQLGRGRGIIRQWRNLNYRERMEEELPANNQNGINIRENGENEPRPMVPPQPPNSPRPE